LAATSQEQFVLHHAALEAGAVRTACQSQRLGQGLGDRLFEVDVLARINRGTGTLRPPAGGAGIEINRDIGVGKARVAVGAPFQTTMRRRQGSELHRVAAEQHRLGHETVAIVERQPTLTADRHQRAQMLGRAEASGGALDDDADRACRHVPTPVASLTLDFPARQGIRGKKSQSGPSNFQERYIYKRLRSTIERI